MRFGLPQMPLGRESNRRGTDKDFMYRSCVIQPTKPAIDPLFNVIVVTDKMCLANFENGSAVIYIKEMERNMICHSNT